MVCHDRLFFVSYTWYSLSFLDLWVFIKFGNTSALISSNSLSGPSTLQPFLQTPQLHIPSHGAVPQLTDVITLVFTLLSLWLVLDGF